MASGGLGSLTVDLLLETAEWITGLNKAEHESEKLAKNIENRLDKMSDSVVNSFKKLAAGAIAAFSVDAIVGFVNATQAAADRLDELAQKSGTSVEYLTQLGEVAAMSGTNVEAVAGAIVKFNKALIEARDPASEAGRAFKAMKISLTEGGEFRATEEVMKDFMLQIGGMKDGAEKTALALRVWGKAGADMLPVANALFQQTEEMTQAQEALGVETGKLAKIAGAYEEQQSLSHTRMKETATLLGQEFLPYLTKLMSQFNALSTSGSGLSTVMTILANSFKVVIIALDAIITGAMLAAQSVAMTYNAFKKLLSGGDVAKEISEGWANMSDTLGQFKERVDALLLPMSEVQRASKEQRDATDEERKALEKLNKETEKRYKWLRELTKPIKVERDPVDHIKLDEMPSLQPTKDYLKEQERLHKEYLANLKDQYGQLYDGIESMARNAFDKLFDGTKGGWKEMLKGMAVDFKKILMDFVWKMVAKPLLLNMVASGGGGLGAYAQSLGGDPNASSWNTLIKGGQSMYDTFFGGGGAGAADAGWTPGSTGLLEYTGGGDLSWTSAGGGMTGMAMTAGAGIVGGAFGGWAAGQYGAGERGVEAATNYAATGAAIGMQVYGPIGAVVGAIIGTIAGIATDPDPDAMRKAVFGQITDHSKGVTKWTGESEFGKFGFSEGEWLSDEQMDESMSRAIKGIEQMDNALAGFMSDEQIEEVKKKLADASKQYELGMEHLDVQGLGAVIKDRLSIITGAFHEGLKEFVDAFEGDTGDLVSIVTNFMQAKTMAETFDPEAILEASKPKKFMDAYQEQRGGLEEFVTTADSSAESMNSLVSQMIAFGAATVQMIAAIDAAAASMHQMFMTTKEKIEMAGMTPEEQYNYLQKQTEELYKQLESETDPAEIQRIAGKINENINKAWDLLTPEQQAAMGKSFTDRLTMLDKAVADKMGALREVVIEDAKGVMQSITDRLEVVFGMAERPRTKTRTRPTRISRRPRRRMSSSGKSPTAAV